MPPAAHSADRAVSRIQNFWLGVENPLIFFLERAEELNLPPDTIHLPAAHGQRKLPTFYG